MTVTHRNVSIREVQEPLATILRQAVEESQIVDVTDQGTLMARLIPAQLNLGEETGPLDAKALAATLRARLPPDQQEATRMPTLSMPPTEEELAAFWQAWAAVAAHLGAQINGPVDAVAMAHDARRDL
jgi:antitoxin (DNA-binding transcriptional repressor) of toxin-antitoxin stability system